MRDPTIHQLSGFSHLAASLRAQEGLVVLVITCKRAIEAPATVSETQRTRMITVAEFGWAYNRTTKSPAKEEELVHHQQQRFQIWSANALRELGLPNCHRKQVKPIPPQQQLCKTASCDSCRERCHAGIHCRCIGRCCHHL